MSCYTNGAAKVVSESLKCRLRCKLFTSSLFHSAYSNRINYSSKNICELILCWIHSLIFVDSPFHSDIRFVKLVKFSKFCLIQLSLTLEHFNFYTNYSQHFCFHDLPHWSIYISLRRFVNRCHFPIKFKFFLANFDS